MRVSKLAFIFGLIAVQLPSLTAQNWEAGLGLGAEFYRGDISASVSNSLRQLQPTINAFGRYHFSDKWAVRGQVGFGTLSGNEQLYGITDTKIERGFAFRSQIIEIGLLPEWRFLHVGKVEFYVFSGISALIYNAQASFNKADDANVALDRAVVYPKTTATIPLGGGIQWFPKETWAIGLEASGRTTFSDYLDGISRAANPNSNDHYVMGTLTVSKFFGGGSRRKNGNGNFGKNSEVGCPTFK
jgi:OmpA-OmpF porin, OOP family